jgi:hypothetical protein
MCVFDHGREVNSGWYYSSAEERDRMVEAERKFIDDRVRKIVDLKREVRLALPCPALPCPQYRTGGHLDERGLLRCCSLARVH